MKRTIQAHTGHTLCIEPTWEIHPTDGLAEAQNFSNFWTVKNWDENGVVMMYVGTGYKGPVTTQSERKQYVVWYRKTKSMWSGFGMTIEKAIAGAIRDGWLNA